MTERVTKKLLSSSKQSLLIDDILAGKHDLISLAKAHHLTPAQVANWIGEPANHQCLRDLCLLADLQTQLLLSRYRATAAARLIQLVTEEPKSDIALRACKELLGADLKLAGGPHVGSDDLSDLEQSIVEQRQVFYKTFGETLCKHTKNKPGK